jgi:hypothetical protein
LPSFNARPEPPLWAVYAGLPEPRDDEDYIEYLNRIGLDPVELLADLTDQTACLANIRLESKLMRSMPRAYRRYADVWVKERLNPERQRHVAILASNLFPEKENRGRSRT